MMNRTQFLLIKLAEEAAEVSQAALKASQFGLSSVYNDTSNNERINLEVNDLETILALLAERKEFETLSALEKMRLSKEKIEKMNHYYNMSVKLGHVEPLK